MKLDAPLRPILWTNPQGTDFSAWPALVDRGQSVLAPLTPELLPTCINALPTNERAEVIKLTLGIGGLGGFEVDPRDSASLQELREVIETNLGWESGEQEEEANYPARVQEISKRWKDAENALDGERSIAAEATERAQRLEHDNTALNARVTELMDIARGLRRSASESLEAAKEAVAALGVATQRNQVLESSLAAAKSDAALFRSLLEQHGIEIPEQ